MKIFLLLPKIISNPSHLGNNTAVLHLIKSRLSINIQTIYLDNHLYCNGDVLTTASYTLGCHWKLGEESACHGLTILRRKFDYKLSTLPIGTTHNR